MIKLSELTKNGGRIVRETTAPLTIDAGDEQRTEQIRVKYYQISVAESRAHQNEIKAKAKAGDVYISDILLPLLAELPDIVEDGKPVEITREMLESLPAPYLKAIQDAIERDIVPKDQPAK